MNDVRRPRLVRTLLAAALTAAFAVTAQGGAFAQTVAAGTDINGVLSSPDINTKKARVGDGFTMTVVPPYPDGDAVFENATIHGHVADVRAAGFGRKPDLKLAFDAITFQDGQTVPVTGSVVSVQAKKENTTVRNAVGAGAGMAVGSQSVGRIIGGAAGGVIGMLGGAIGGYLFARNDKANFSVARGARVTFQVTSALEVPRRQAAH
ncbi:MAG: hypothetical protein WAJ85_12165 [Candidatus Baltobacteraceae bacterium]|jgi:hypothetical protein